MPLKFLLKAQIGNVRTIPMSFRKHDPLVHKLLPCSGPACWQASAPALIKRHASCPETAETAETL